MHNIPEEDAKNTTCPYLLLLYFRNKKKKICYVIYLVFYFDNINLNRNNVHYINILLFCYFYALFCFSTVVLFFLFFLYFYSFSLPAIKTAYKEMNSFLIFINRSYLCRYKFCFPALSLTEHTNQTRWKSFFYFLRLFFNTHTHTIFLFFM